MGEVWKTAVDKIREYSPSDLYVRVIDSSSKDDTVAVAKKQVLTSRLFPAMILIMEVHVT